MIDDLDLPLVLSRWRTALVGVTLGLLAWGIVSLSVAEVVALAGAKTTLSIAPLFAKATLIGGLSLAPAGAGVTGSLFGFDVIRHGGAPGAVFAAVVTTCAFTVWLALAVGFVALAWSAASTRPIHDHFERFSPEYDAQIPAHIRDLLVRGKTERMLAHLPLCVGARGIDIGCGLGWYLNALMAVGARPTGIDHSAAQARTARAMGADVVRASATHLPFASGAFDFAYAVNVLHHLPGPASQGAALSEASRVLKPGGLFFLHEINVANPIFRFYMSYAFPLIKRIDEGIEFWLDPENLPLAGTGLCVEEVEYFTFVPDFLPAPMMGRALAFEARLEASRWRRYSAHYMVVLRKEEPRG